MSRFREEIRAASEWYGGRVSIPGATSTGTGFGRSLENLQRKARESMGAKFIDRLTKTVAELPPDQGEFAIGVVVRRDHGAEEDYQLRFGQGFVAAFLRPHGPWRAVYGTPPGDLSHPDD